MRLVLLFALVASAQPPADSNVEKVFRFAHTETPQSFQEIVNTIRSIADVRQAALVVESKALAVRGTAAQVSIAEWLFRELDQSGVPSTSAKLEYAVPGASNELVRVFYAVNVQTPQGLQEIVNAVRSVGEIQRMFIYNARRALVLRGTAAQASLAEWMIQALDRPAGGGPFATVGQTLTAPEFRMRDGSASVVRIFYPAHIVTPQHRQESINMIRSLAEIQRCVAYNGAGAIVVRGSTEQVALAERLLDELAKPR